MLKNFKCLLDYIQSRSLSPYNSINKIDFSTLYTTIPPLKAIGQIKIIIQFCLMKKLVQRRYKYLVLGSDESNSAIKEKKKKKQPLWFFKQVLCNWYHQNIRVFDWQHICDVWWTCISTDSLNTYGYKLCSFSRWLVPLFVWGRLHIRSSQEKRKEASPILQFHVVI